MLYIMKIKHIMKEKYGSMVNLKTFTYLNMLGMSIENSNLPLFFFCEVKINHRSKINVRKQLMLSAYTYLQSKIMLMSRQTQSDKYANIKSCAVNFKSVSHFEKLFNLW